MGNERKEMRVIMIVKVTNNKKIGKKKKEKNKEKKARKSGENIRRRKI